MLDADNSQSNDGKLETYFMKFVRQMLSGEQSRVDHVAIRPIVVWIKRQKSFKLTFVCVCDVTDPVCCIENKRYFIQNGAYLSTTQTTIVINGTSQLVSSFKQLNYMKRLLHMHYIHKHKR